MATSAANVSLESLLLSINALETKVKEIEERRTSGAKPSNRENKAARSVLKSCLSENAAIAYRIRDSTALDDEQRTSALKRISDLEHLALYGYFSRRGDDGIDPVDPYHRNLYIDREESILSRFADNFFRQFMGIGGPPSPPPVGRASIYNPNIKPSEHTSPLSRFHAFPAPVADATPLVRSVREARCEISADGICNPIKIEATDSQVAIIASGGFKDRDPQMHIYKLDQNRAHLSVSQSHKLGLADIAFNMCVDEQNGLVWTADKRRIKSYRWVIRERNDGEDSYYRGCGKIEGIHTFDSINYEGPIASINGGATVLRAGKKAISIWDVDSAATHAKAPRGVIGRRLRTDDLDSWRDPDDLENSFEVSSGQQRTRQTALDADAGAINTWAPHPTASARMICGFSDAFRCMAVDVETGKITDRWLGHGDVVSRVLTTPADPNVFLTTSDDGVARIYDVRQPLPVFAAFSTHERICAALAHPDGAPYLFVGGARTEGIKCWDVRGCGALYELATGNAAVIDLTWSAATSTLLAATACEYVDRIGYHHGYRRLYLPKPESERNNGDDESDEEDDWDESDDDDDGDGRYWPDRAPHRETDFREPLDLGDHSILAYQFKDNASPKKIPDYGCGAPEREMMW